MTSIIEKTNVWKEFIIHNSKSVEIIKSIDNLSKSKSLFGLKFPYWFKKAKPLSAFRVEDLYKRSKLETYSELVLNKRQSLTWRRTKKTCIEKSLRKKENAKNKFNKKSSHNEKDKINKRFGKTIKHLSRKKDKLESRLNKVIRQNSDLKKQLQQVTKHGFKQIMRNINSIFSVYMKKFEPRYTRNSKQAKQRKRYTIKEKKTALKLFKNDKMLYILMSHFVMLPDQKILKSFM